MQDKKNMNELIVGDNLSENPARLDPLLLAVSWTALICLSKQLATVLSVLIRSTILWSHISHWLWENQVHMKFPPIKNLFGCVNMCGHCCTLTHNLRSPKIIGSVSSLIPTWLSLLPDPVAWYGTALPDLWISLASFRPGSLAQFSVLCDALGTLIMEFL